ncbi:MAG: cob(I)yrinic acid a,c-diamide adenosyltransferase [Candidatus Omnitrophica bacterium]|nr:cob(I)yrinic acid a,c-diamide adenosyltransferase [Candidatus Omnitrophota bacterium]MCM8802348.1 cob(I)yrinic acid a,c-diamide adenosyltransferase [Candidatus Omnitrophota bacterium]
MRKGLIEVYTGDGKGKTTAAIGIALRAKSHNLNVCFIFFHKNPLKWKYGEFETIKKSGIDIFYFATKHPHFEKVNKDDIRKECLEGLEFLKKIYKEKKYDMIILDEILISLRDGFLKEEEIIEIMEQKPENIELILTGRGATKKIIEKADYVSEIKKIKHPFDKGIKARKGIEY